MLGSAEMRNLHSPAVFACLSEAIPFRIRPNAVARGVLPSRSLNLGGPMERIQPLSLIFLAGVVLLAATACAGGQSERDEPSSNEWAAVEAEPLADPPPRPIPCDSSDACQDACPLESKACVCASVGPQGENACVPACDSDADCPSPPDGVTLQCREGICVPDRRPPPPPKRCDDDAACAGECPAGAKGCACHQPPRGDKVCAPTCGTDADCPTGEGIPPLSCHDGFCVPAGPPPR